VRVAIVTTYRPRACGIAVFSGDLRRALLEAESFLDVDIVSIVRGTPPSSPPEVAVTIRQDVPSDYPAAAAELARRQVDVVLVEHEYGIFGGEDGEFVLGLTDELEVPYVVTLHTVLGDPSPRQAANLSALCRRAALVMVFTETARQMVIEQNLATPEQVRVVPHGAPDILNPMHGSWRDPRSLPSLQTAGMIAAVSELGLDGLADRTVLSTFGLISASKGLELMIRALPPVVAARPDVLYLIAGQTHPEVVKHEGERYRLGLEQLVRDLGLTEHVSFVDRFLSVDELAVLLGRTDLYVTPYRSPEQIVSGALTFAVAAGCPVVSTPYRYAENLLSSGAGVLVPFGDVPRLSAAVLDLLNEPDRLAAARAEARRVGADLSWANVGKVTLEVLAEAVHDVGPPTIRPRVAMASLPQLQPGHLLRLVDDVGIVQHAWGTVPARSTGYCVDDVARLAIVALHLERTFDDAAYRRVLVTALAFLVHAWDPAAPGMHNFMDYSRRWLDEPHLGDHVGRAVWALGEVVASDPRRDESRACLRLLNEMTPVLDRLTGPREMAFALLGLIRPDLDALPAPLQEAVRTLADRLAGWYDRHRRDGWDWFQEQLTYDNGRLPHALIAAGSRLGDPDLLQRGASALDWYAHQCGVDGPAVRLVGNRWREADRSVPIEWEGDEQPLDAAALVEALVVASTQTGGEHYGRQAVRAFEWFLGRNAQGLAVYDFATGGCHDGLGPSGRNENEGAESTLAFLQAFLALEGAGLQGFVGRSE
jgi:glycosyltransferase involved in cell wall biosynthesis